MKLIYLNCQGAFRKKAIHFLEINPDILVIQECKHPDKLNLTHPPKNLLMYCGLEIMSK